jgi:CheY-like chemotaxis protein
MVAIAAKAEPAPVAKPSKTILVVEDEPTVLALAVSIIEDDLGYAALSAANAREALALLQQDQIDLLFTDQSAGWPRCH